jgi:hypothetical protein
MHRIQLGDLATWLAAIGTVAAFFLAFGQLESERRHRRQETTEAQARKISAWVAKEESSKTKGRPPVAWIAVLNDSNEPVYEVIATIVRFPHLPQRDGTQEGQGVPLDFRGFLSVVPPGKSYVSVSGGYRGMHFQPAVEVAFKDSNGKPWLRTRSGGCFKLKQGPIEFYKFQPPMSWQLPKQEIPT